MPRNKGQAEQAYDTGPPPGPSPMNANFLLLRVGRTRHFISKRVSKPGGRIAATARDLTGGLVFNRIFWDVAAMLDPEAEKWRQTAFSRPLTRPNELAQAWTSAGLKEVRSGEITIRTEFLSFDDFWKPFAEGDGPIPAYVQRTDDVLRSKLEEALRGAYLGGEKDGPRSYAATAWVVSGLKPVEA